MILVAEIELEEEGVLAQLEKTREAQFKLSDELCQLEKMLRKASIRGVKEKEDSEESPKD